MRPRIVARPRGRARRADAERRSCLSARPTAQRDALGARRRRLERSCADFGLWEGNDRGAARQRAVRRRSARRTLCAALRDCGHGFERGSLRRNDRVGARYLRRRPPIRFAIRARAHRHASIFEPARLFRPKSRRRDTLRRNACRGRARADRAARPAETWEQRRSRDRRADAPAYEREHAHIARSIGGHLLGLSHPRRCRSPILDFRRRLRLHRHALRASPPRSKHRFRAAGRSE